MNTRHITACRRPLLMACALALAGWASLPVQAQGARSHYLPRTERGRLAEQVVLRWSVEGARRHETTPKAWAGAMGSAFAKAPLEKLRQATRAGTLEQMVASLQGDLTTSAALGPYDNLAFYALPPCRIANTRLALNEGDRKLAAGETRTFTAVGSSFVLRGGADHDCGVASDARGVVVRVTATDQDNLGHLTVFPADGSPFPSATSSLNYTRGVTIGNEVHIKFSDFHIFTNVGTNLVLDVVGYFKPAVTGFGCTPTSEAQVTVADGQLSTSKSPPACPSGMVQAATYCRTLNRESELMGVRPNMCIFGDAASNGIGGTGFASANCCQ